MAAPELITDRPDQTESSETVPRGMVQIETGYSHTEDDDAGFDVDVDSLPETLARIGLSDNVELRVGFDGYQWVDVGPLGDVDGAADSSLGVKIGLVDENGCRPQIAVLGQVSLPTGSDAFTTDRADPAFRVTFANTLSETLSLGYNVGAAWATEEDGLGDRHTLSVVEWTVALGIAGGERLGFFVELFGEAGLSASGPPSHSFDGGATYLLRDNVQLDAAVGVGLSDAADDWFALVGVSFRL